MSRLRPNKEHALCSCQLYKVCNLSSRKIRIFRQNVWWFNVFIVQQILKPNGIWRSIIDWSCNNFRKYLEFLWMKGFNYSMIILSLVIKNQNMNMKVVWNYCTSEFRSKWWLRGLKTRHSSATSLYPINSSNSKFGCARWSRTNSCFMSWLERRNFNNYNQHLLGR